MTPECLTFTKTSAIGLLVNLSVRCILNSYHSDLYEPYTHPFRFHLPLMKQQVKKVSSYLQSDVDLQRCNPISLYSCLLSGFTSCITFSVSPASHRPYTSLRYRHAIYGVDSKRRSSPVSGGFELMTQWKRSTAGSGTR